MINSIQFHMTTETRLRPVDVGGVRVFPLLLAPMAGYTDRTFRSLCARFGCGLTFSEMVSVKSVVYGNERVKDLIANDTDTPFAVQLFGRDPRFFSEAVKRLEEYPIDFIDINMGCPVKKIIKNGEGCALMDEPVLAGRIVESAVRASDKPVTVKMRKGFLSGSNAAEIAVIVQESGASAVTVHGRTRDQFYSGDADLQCVADVKSALRIPVFGNGGIFTEEDAEKMIGETQCDGIMVARGALGNPWIFEKMNYYLQTGIRPPSASVRERVETAAAHLRDAVINSGERIGLMEMRKVIPFYLKGFARASELRRRINMAVSSAEMETALNECADTLN